MFIQTNKKQKINKKETILELLFNTRIVSFYKKEKKRIVFIEYFVMSSCIASLFE